MLAGVGGFLTFFFYCIFVHYHLSLIDVLIQKILVVIPTLPLTFCMSLSYTDLVSVRASVYLPAKWLP